MPRFLYTGPPVWNRQRKAEVLLDVHDVALGRTTVMGWNDQTSGSSAHAIRSSPRTGRRSTPELTPAVAGQWTTET